MYKYTNAYIDLSVISTLTIIIVLYRVILDDSKASVAPVKVVAVKLEMTILLNIVVKYVGLSLCEAAYTEKS